MKEVPDMPREFDLRYSYIRPEIERVMPTSILDVGTGGGDFARGLSDIAHVTAVDKLPGGRRSGGDNVTWVNQELNATSISKLDRHDVVIALSVLHHMKDWRESLFALRQIARRALIIEVPNPKEELTKAAMRKELPLIHEAVESVSIKSLGSSPATRQYHLLRNTYTVPPLVVGTVFAGGQIHSKNSLLLREEFTQALGYEPYPGSLNLRTDHPADFGPSHCYVDGNNKRYNMWNARINGVDAPVHIMSPWKNHTKHVIELLSSARLRDFFNEDEEVQVEVIY